MLLLTSLLPPVTSSCRTALEMVDIGLVAEEGMSVAMKKDSAGLTELSQLHALSS